MKVISGFLKGRIINGYKTEGTRPTMDSVKESLFAMIQSDIKDSICLDLFAGSGSLGIEAISNGAKFVYFVDHNKKILNILKKNIVNFKIETFSKVILSDYKKALLKFNTSNIKFNLVFLDPPYQVHVIEDILKFLNEKDMIAPTGQVICEFNNEALQDSYGSLNVIKKRQYGDKTIYIYKNRLY